MNTRLDEQARHYAVAAAAIDYIRRHAARQPGLDEIAAAVHMSPFHFELQAAWPRAGFVPRETEAAALLDRVFSAPAAGEPLHLLLRGTNFQIKVWEALIRIEPGHLASYGALARQAAAPKAQRAVGNALAANTIAYLIPCHRVIRESGEPGNYRWGTERKLAMQGWEAVQQFGRQGRGRDQESNLYCAISTNTLRATASIELSICPMVFPHKHDEKH